MNRILLNRKVQIDFSKPWRFTSLRKAQSGDAEWRSHEAASSENFTYFIGSGCRESNPVFTLPKGTYCRYTTSRLLVLGRRCVLLHPPNFFKKVGRARITPRYNFYHSFSSQQGGNGEMYILKKKFFALLMLVRQW